MSFFSSIFGKSNNNGVDTHSEVKFGRSTAVCVSNEQHSMLTQANDLYAESNYIESYAMYLAYLKSIAGAAVEYRVDKEENSIDFSLIHGSKEIMGSLKSGEISAQSVVATFQGKPDVALMRYLLAQNNDALYCKFGIVGNMVILCQRSPAEDMSPISLNDMLSEIAINANAAGEHISAEFPELAVSAKEYTEELPSQELKTKICFMRIWIRETFGLVESTDIENLKSYIILRVVFKILYLVSPEGALYNSLENMLHIYAEYKPEDDNGMEVNYRMLEVLEDIISMPDHELAKSLYRTYTVFPELNYCSYMELADSIENLMKLPARCAELRRPDLVTVMCEYIVGFQEMKYGVHPLAAELLLLFWRVLNAEYFYGLGFRNMLYNETVGALAGEKIVAEINVITTRYAERYQGLQFGVQNLSFDSLEAFAATFLLEFNKLRIPD
jgi:hypothetical protein